MKEQNYPKRKKKTSTNNKHFTQRKCKKGICHKSEVESNCYLSMDAPEYVFVLAKCLTKPVLL